MDIEVEQIAIIIETDILNKTKNDFLTKHIFYGYNSSYKKNFYEEYPFFTGSVRIPKSYLLRKSFDEKIMFFFNRKIFIETLSNKKNYSYSENKDFKEDDNVKVVLYNLKTMIQLLFTTVYPTVNDNKDSFEQNILKRGSYTLSLDGTVPKFFKNVFPSLNVDFSYIVLDGKDYTVTSTCILNDIVNHPEYNKMIHKLVEFTKWKIQTSNEIELKMTRIRKKIQFNIEENFLDKPKIEYEFVKNMRNSNYYGPNDKLEQKIEKLTYLFDKFSFIINISDTIVKNDIAKNNDSIDFIMKNIIEDDNNRHAELLRHDNDDNDDMRSIISRSLNTNNYITGNINDINDDIQRIYEKYGSNSIRTNRLIIDELTNDIFKDIKTVFDDKYSFQTIRSLIDEYLTMMIIKIKYFDPKKSTENYDVLSGEIEMYFKQNYKKYFELLQYISNFVDPNRITSNKPLQGMINDFYENKNDELEQFMTQVVHRYINDDDNVMTEIDLQSLDTGVNSYNTENNFGKLKYEAHVSFDLILGKLTQEDLSNITCEYKDEELGVYFDSRRSDKVDEFIHKPKLIEREKMIKIAAVPKVNGGKKNSRKTKNVRNNKKKDKYKKKTNTKKRQLR